MTNTPEEFICPITLDIMSDPVLCEDGYTYERKAIMSIRNSLSPMTRQPIDIQKLLPNRALKDCIQRYKQSKKDDDTEIITKSSFERDRIQYIQSQKEKKSERERLERERLEREKKVRHSNFNFIKEIRELEKYNKEKRDKKKRELEEKHELEKQIISYSACRNQILISKYNEKNPSFKWGKRLNLPSNGNCSYYFHPAVNKDMHKFIFDIKMIELIKNKDNTFLINYKKIKEDYKWIMKYNNDNHDQSYVNFVFDEIIPNIDTIIQEIEEKVRDCEKCLENSIKESSGTQYGQYQIAPHSNRVSYIKRILLEYTGLKSQIHNLKSREYYFENLYDAPFKPVYTRDFPLNADVSVLSTNTCDFKYHNIYLTWNKKKINIMDSLISSINMITINEEYCTFRYPYMHSGIEEHRTVNILDSYKEYVFTATHEKMFDGREGYKVNFMTEDYSFKFFEPIILLAKNIIDLTEEVS